MMESKLNICESFIQQPRTLKITERVMNMTIVQPTVTIKEPHVHPHSLHAPATYAYYNTVHGLDNDFYHLTLRMTVLMTSMITVQPTVTRNPL